MLWSYRGRRSFSTILTFGMHKGKAYDEVIQNHPQYVEWMKSLTQQSPMASDFLNYARTAGTRQNNDTYVKKAPPTYKNLERNPNNFRARRTNSKYQHEASPVTGSSILTFGKYSDQSFESVFEKDNKYCMFMANQVHEKMVNTNLLHFIVYCQQRWLQPSVQKNVMTRIEAPADCLKGRKFVVTGSSVGVYSRPKIEKCLQFFGASISASCTKDSEGLLLVAKETIDGRPIEESSKYRNALEKGIKIMDISEFLKKKLHRPGKDTAAFDLIDGGKESACASN